jgi:hypothetical protein
MEAGGMSKNETYIAHNRVSMEGQSRTGLGFEAQRAPTKAFTASCGASAKLPASHTEVETGKRADRAGVARARAAYRRLPFDRANRRTEARRLSLQLIHMKFVTPEIYKTPVLLLVVALVMVSLSGSYFRARKMPLQPNKSIAKEMAGEQRYLIWNEWTFSIDNESFALFQQRVDLAKAAASMRSG